MNWLKRTFSPAYRERELDALVEKAFTIVGGAASLGGYPRPPGSSSGLLRSRTDSASVLSLGYKWVSLNIVEPGLLLSDQAGETLEGTQRSEALFPFTRVMPIERHIIFAALQLLSNGNAWWLKDTDRVGGVRSMIPIMASSISVERLGAQIGRIWIKDSKGRRREYAYKDFHHIALGMSPDCPMLGESPILSSVRHTMSDEEWSITSELIAQRAASPIDLITPETASGSGGVSGLAKELGDEGVLRLKAKIKDALRGTDRLLPIVLGKSMNMQSSGQMYSGIEKLMTIPAIRIAASMGLSASTLNLPAIDGKLISGEERSASQEVDTENCLVPLWSLIARSWTDDLGISLPGAAGLGGIKFAFDIKAVVALQRKTSKTAEWVNKSYAGGIITQNEAREKLNFPPTDGGDMFALPSTMNALEAGRMQILQSLAADRESIHV